MIQLPKDKIWEAFIQMKLSQNYLKEILFFLHAERAKGKIIYPSDCELFFAFETTPFEKIKAVIIGQDPYHNPGQANGLCFSVKDQLKIPPSLKNIFKELVGDLNIPEPKSGNLNKWAQEGVLMLNTSLSVESNKPMSHSNIGWSIFTDAVLKKISKEKENIVFILWGKLAQSKSHLIDSHKHLILKAAHPSPLSAHNGFWGCKHFSKTNEYLFSKGIQPIDWQL
jgi:uracil-DNA glycosylase